MTSKRNLKWLFKRTCKERKRRSKGLKVFITAMEITLGAVLLTFYVKKIHIIQYLKRRCNQKVHLATIQK